MENLINNIQNPPTATISPPDIISLAPVIKTKRQNGEKKARKTKRKKKAGRPSQNERNKTTITNSESKGSQYPFGFGSSKLLLPKI